MVKQVGEQKANGILIPFGPVVNKYQKFTGKILTLGVFLDKD